MAGQGEASSDAQKAIYSFCPDAYCLEVFKPTLCEISDRRMASRPVVLAATRGICSVHTGVDFFVNPK